MNIFKRLFGRKEVPFVNNYYEEVVRLIKDHSTNSLIDEVMQLSCLQLSGTVQQTIYYNGVAGVIMQEVNERMIDE